MPELQDAKSLTLEGVGELPKRIDPAGLLARLSRWRERSVNRRIFAAMVTVGALTCAVKLVATFKEVVVARQFGVSDGLDAFLIAFLLPSFAINVVAGSFNAALIPTYIQVRDGEGREAAQRLLSSVSLLAGLLLLALAGCLALAARDVLPVLGSSFGPEKLELTRKLLLIMLPTLPLTGMFAIWASVLNAGERFAIVAITPLLTPLAVILGVHQLGGGWGVYSYAAAIVAGTLLEGLLLATALRRQGVSLVPRWHGLSPEVRQVIKQYVPMIAAAGTMGSTGLIDQSMAAMLGPGSVSALNYGNKVSGVIVGIGALALSTAVLTQFSKMVAAREWTAVRHTLKTYTRLILLTTMPLTLLLVVASRPLVALLFERGAFTAADTVQVASVQSMYILQMPFYVLGMLFVRLTSALKANYILMWGTVISFILNIALNYGLMKWLGLPGIALATSAVYLVSLCYLSIISTRLLKREERCALL